MAITLGYSTLPRLLARNHVWAKYVISANRTVDYEDYAYIPHPGCMCLASGCMAWRWFINDKGFCGAAGNDDGR